VVPCHQSSIGYRKGGFQADEPGGSLCLIALRMGGMVRGNGIDGSVLYAFDKSAYVFCSSEGRVNPAAAFCAKMFGGFFG